MTRGKTPPQLVYLVAMLGIVIWGASPAATKLAVMELDGWSVALFRTVVAALLIFPLATIKRLPIPSSKASWFALATSSVAGFILYTVLYSVGLQYTSTIHAALIVAAAPIVTGLIGFSMDKNWPRALWWWGAAIAFSGEIFLILSSSHGEMDGASLWGDLLVLVSIICVSAGYVAGGRLSASIGTWGATAWSLSLAGFILLPAFVPVATSTDWMQISSTGWMALIYLVLFISIIGYACWYWSIGELGVAAIAPIQFGLPLVSILIGVLFMKEPFTQEIVIATVAILLGVFVTQKA